MSDVRQMGLVATEIRKLPREQRNEILSNAADQAALDGIYDDEETPDEVISVSEQEQFWEMVRDQIEAIARG